jgi:hypothetical protein
VFDIGGLAVGQYSVLQINGAATFSGGNIEFDFIGGYKPSAGNLLGLLIWPIPSPIRICSASAWWVWMNLYGKSES